jgi:hypothetical protein
MSMTHEEFLEMQKRNKELESKMTKEEKLALEQARRRHSKKVRDEILTSHELDKQKNQKCEEE